jgi:hypothetical protein
MHAAEKHEGPRMGSTAAHTHTRLLSRAPIVLAVVLAGLLGAGPAATVHGCSCVIPVTDAEYFEQADVVFTGTVTAQRDRSAGARGTSSTDPITWTFSVDGLAKGGVHNPQDVDSARHDASCGVPFTVGSRYQVYAQYVGSGLTTNLCSGTRQLAPLGPAAGVPPDTSPAPPP